MSSKRNSIKSLHFLAAFVVVFSTLALVPYLRASAADLSERTVLIGSSFASEVTTHTYSFNTVTPSVIGSMRFQYCTNSPLFNLPCSAPAGLNTTSASIVNQSGISGFSMSASTTASEIVITKAPSFSGPTSTEYVLGNIVNPSTSNQIVYVRVTVYAGINGTGSIVDTGAVAFVVDDRYNVDAYVPPYLTFCAAVTVALDCTTTTGFLADFGEFSQFTPSAVTSQFSVATNDFDGYNVFIGGQEPTSGANVIPALLSQASSAPGNSQFGINLRANNIPFVGANPEAGPLASGAPAPSYNAPNLFKFTNGDLVAQSTIATGFNRYTVSYMVNIAEGQAPGIYATTFTYTAIASF